MTGIVLITGGQQGIGFGIAKTLIDAGYRVVLASNMDPATEVVQHSLSELGENAHYFVHDVANIETISLLLDQIESTVGQVTTLVNNAGVGAPVRGDLLKIKPENFDFVLDINLRGTFFLTQEIARRMLERHDVTHYQSIIFIGSVSASMVSVERAEYCISKAGTAMISQLFAVRLAEHNIGVFELRPGVIATGMTAGVKDSYTNRIENGLVPAKRWGYPEDIAQVVLPLVEGQMRFATGTTIPVDGGLSISRL